MVGRGRLVALAAHSHPSTPGRACRLGGGRRIRGIIVAEGDLIACQTWIEGTLTGPFTHSPAGKLEPNGARVVWDLMSMFRFDDRGRLVEEFVRTDNRSFLRQLGAEVA
jgi:SnoaL-like polyketide cyclase